MLLKNKTILINGAAGRLGFAFAKEILKNGGQVVLADVNENQLKKIQKNLDENKSYYIVVDNKNENSSIDKCINFSIEKFGKLDSAIHTAYPKSEKWGAKFENLEYRHLSQDLSLQLGGTILFSQKIINQFKKQGYGSLIHISSIQGISAPKFEHYVNTKMSSPIEYSAMKAGVISLTKYLAKYYKNQNIRVNCISPGGILDNQPQDFIEKYRHSCCSKGLLDPEDVAGTACFLLSDLSNFITGQNIIVDDGWSL